MDIASSSSAMSLSTVQTQASVMVMRKVLDNDQQAGQAISTLLSPSATSQFSPAHLGQSVDISA